MSSIEKEIDNDKKRISENYLNKTHVVDGALPVSGYFVDSLDEKDFALEYISANYVFDALSDGVYKRTEETDEMLFEGRGIIGYAIRTGECLVIPDVRADSQASLGVR